MLFYTMCHQWITYPAVLYPLSCSLTLFRSSCWLSLPLSLSLNGSEPAFGCTMHMSSFAAKSKTYCWTTILPNTYKPSLMQMWMQSKRSVPCTFIHAFLLAFALKRERERDRAGRDECSWKIETRYVSIRLFEFVKCTFSTAHSQCHPRRLMDISNRINMSN